METKLPLSHKLCYICLSIEKPLTVLENEELNFYINILLEIPAEPSIKAPQVCLGCSNSVHDARALKEQVKSSYLALQDYIEVEVESNISETKPFQSIEEDQLNNEDMVVKEEHSSDGIEWTDNEVMVKEYKEDSSDSIYKDLPLSSTKENYKKKKKQKKKESIQKKVSKKTKIDLNIDQKIKIIKLNYAEMIEARENDMKADSYVLADFKCEGCILGFNIKKAYDKHIIKKHCESIGKYKCPICRTVHPSLEIFTKHYKRHMRRYVCGICNIQTADIKSMQSHTLQNHEVTIKEYKCKHCGEVFNSPNSHRYHLDTHKGRLKCIQCDKTFTHRSALKNHKTSVHDLNNKFPCDICKKVFRWRTSLSRHIATFHKNKNTSVAYCELCNVSFTMISNYQRHLNTSLKHVSKDQHKFICDHCNRRFSNKTKLRDHIEDKHLHRTYTCGICNKVSKNRVALDQHIRNVHKRRPKTMMCHHCGKGFPTKCQLESHIRMHTGERPFFCQYCNSTFSQQSNLYKHNKQVHLNLKPKKYTMLKKLSEDKPPETSIEHTTPYPTLAFEYTTVLNDNMM